MTQSPDLQPDTSAENVLTFGLHDSPPLPQTLLAALAHLLAMVAGIATAPLLIARGLGADDQMTAYIIGSALVVSGLATFVQVRRLGPLGSGLLSVQGTSFSFIGVMIFAASALPDALSTSQKIGVLLGSGMAGALVTVAAGFYIEKLQRVITLNVTALAIFLLGLSLVGSAWSNLQFTLGASTDKVAVWLQAATVIATIVLLATRTNPWARLLAIPAGLLAGMLLAWWQGALLSVPAAQGLMLLQWQPFPLGFDLLVFVLLLPVFFVTMTEAVGDLTATTMLSRQPLSGTSYWQRIRGGVMADGCNSVLAGLVGTFPNTTFSQNNGVIQLTGVASRKVGYWVAGALVLLGTLPAFVGLFQMIPGGVLHAATGLLFAMIALAGLRLLAADGWQRRGIVMLVVCTLAAFALTLVPGIAASAGLALPQYAAMMLGFPVATGAFIAVIWEAVAGESDA